MGSELARDSLGDGTASSPRSRPSIAFLLTFLLLGTALLTSTYPATLAMIGLGALVAALATIVLAILPLQIPRCLLRPWWLLGAIYASSFLLHPGLGAVKYVVQLAAAVLAFLWGWQVRVADHAVAGLKALRLLMLGFAAVGAATDHFIYPETESFTNPNMVGAVAISLIFVDAMVDALRSRRPGPARILFRLVPPVGLLLLAGARSAFLALLAFGFVFVVWRLISASRLRFGITFAGVVSIIVGTAYFLTQFGAEIEVYEALQESSIEYTSKNLGTRTAQWNAVIPEIAARPIFGWGLERAAEEVAEAGSESAHSQYLELGLKTGAVGILSLAATLACLWGLTWTARARPEARVSGAILVGVMMHQTFEVVLLQNHLALGLIWWMLMGIGASAAIDLPGPPQPTPVPDIGLQGPNESDQKG